MAWDAVVYSDDGKTFRFGTHKKKTLFQICQSRYGHCLGKIIDNAGDSIGWRFAKCGSGKECMPTVYEIIIKEV